jgi:hypothetical protein
MENDSRKPRFRPRIAVKTSLLLITIVALSLTVVILYREQRVLRAAAEQWRSEFGILTIDDPAKIHAVRIRYNEDLQWAWRVYIPDGAKADLGYAVRNIPKTGLAKNPGRMHGLEPGEHVIRFSIRKDPRTDEWKSVVETGSVTAYGTILEDQRWFLQKSQTTSFNGVGTKTQMEEDNSGTLVLHRLRSLPRDASGGASPSVIEEDVPRPGFMIWLERQ